VVFAVVTMKKEMQMMKKGASWFLVYLILAMVLSGCRWEQSDRLSTLVPQAMLPTAVTPLSTPLPTLSPPPVTPTPSPTPTLPTIGAAAGVPAALRAAWQEWTASSPDYTWEETGAPDLLLQLSPTDIVVAEWVYALAGSFDTVPDGLTIAELGELWDGAAVDGWELLLTEEIVATFTPFWGPPAATIPVLTAAELSEQIWERRRGVTILPFAALDATWKVLSVDGRSPLAPDFSPDTYPLLVPIYLAGAPGDLPALDGLPRTNRDGDKLTRLAMSGVTALVRATAYQMELNGIDYPGTAVAEIFRQADIAHVSNEVSFAADCPYPDPFGGTLFCSRESYFALLTGLGIDVVELTGNHLNDWGWENLIATLDLYDAAGMKWFGGGADLADAQRALTFNHNGNNIAFVGCNPVGPAYAWATADTPGSRPCEDGFYTQINELVAAGYQVIVTLQYSEFYDYLPTAKQQIDFARAAAAGATAVSGSQGHHAQGFAFVEGAFVHYGMGNLFFDQMDMLGTRQTLVDTYVFYDGALVSVEIWTGLIENYARPREMSADERQQTLQTLFEASDW
jgi:hypothetical protein